MKILSLGAIGLGVLCLVVTVVEKLLGKNFFRVAPANYLAVASALFLLAVALMCYDRFYGSAKEQK